MKKIIKLNFIVLFLSFASISLFSQAPSYTDWEWDAIRIGYSNVNGLSNSDSGFTFAMGVRFNVKDKLSIGYTQGFSGYVSNIISDDFDFDFITNNSLNVDKYFSSSSAKRAFVGLGVGYNTQTRTVIRDEEGEQIGRTERSVGISPRLGYELGHVRIMADYNYTLNENMGNSLNLTMAATLWGGYQKK